MEQSEKRVWVNLESYDAKKKLCKQIQTHLRLFPAQRIPSRNNQTLLYSFCCVRKSLIIFKLSHITWYTKRKNNQTFSFLSFTQKVRIGITLTFPKLPFNMWTMLMQHVTPAHHTSACLCPLPASVPSAICALCGPTSRSTWSLPLLTHVYKCYR